MLGKYFQRLMIPSFPEIENSCSTANLKSVPFEPANLEKSCSRESIHREHPGTGLLVFGPWFLYTLRVTYSHSSSPIHWDHDPH
jgi:hypothetical protein